MATKLAKNKKYYVLDTNVLLHDPQALSTFTDVTLIIPFVVLEELDSFKSESGEIGRNAREIIRTIDELRRKGHLGDGIPLPHDPKGTRLQVLPTPPKEKLDEASRDIADNIILQTVKNLRDQGYTATLITKDINARVKGDALGIDVMDYAMEPIDATFPYKGWIRLPLSSQDIKKVTAKNIHELCDLNTLHINQFVVAEHDQNPSQYKLYRYLGEHFFKEIRVPDMKWSYEVRNVQQLMAIDLLMDDEIKCVSLQGAAGSGKTFLTLLAGLEKVMHQQEYRKFLLTRALVALGADIGFLPGELQEKLHYWMMPIQDNLDFIFSKSKGLGGSDTKKGRRRRAPRRRDEEWRDLTDLDHLKQRGIISIEAITYMRGRSIPSQFIFIDEVQNLSPHEVKTMVSRAGEGSKVILAGDPYQIDSPYLDFASNGLTVTTEKFKGQSLFGTVFLEKSERSKLAEMAATLL